MSEADRMAKALLARMDAELFAAITGPVRKQRETALRVRGTAFEVVELDDNGLVIEPIRCTCGAWFLFTCELHRGGVT